MRLSLSAPLLLSTLLAPIAHAKVVYKNGNWQLDDRSLDVAPQSVCALVQEAKIGKTTWRLEITHAKNAVGITEVLLKQTGGTTKSWSIKPATGETLVFASAGVTGTTNLLWHIPQKTSALIAQWDAGKDLQVTPADGSRGGFKLFDSGFSFVKKEMEKRCLGTIPLVDTAFEAAFLKRTTPIDPNLVSVEAVARLREILPQAHSTFLEVGANGQELSALRAQYAAPLQEASTLEATIARVQQTEIPQLETAQRNNESLEVSAKAELQRLTALIPGQERALTTATQARDRAYQAIEPHLNEHEVLSDAVDSAQDQIYRGESRISEIDYALSRANASIRSLNSELPGVQSALRQNESSLRQAESDFRRAESEFRSFNPSSELRRRLQNDYSYQNATRDLSRVERESARAHSDWKRDVADRDNKERAVNACRAQGPEADCRSQQDDWKRAVAQAERSEQEYRRFDGQISSLRMTISNSERSAEREVERERNVLGDRMSQTQRRYNEFSIAVSQGQARERDIVNDLSSLRDQVNSLDRERPLLVDQVSRGRSDLSRSTSALASFEARVGWNAKLTAYNNAEAAQNARQSELNTTLRGKATAEANIRQAQTQRPLLAQQLVEKRQLLTTSQARLVEVRRALAPFETERARIEGAGLEIAGRLAGLATEFEGQLPQ